MNYPKLVNKSDDNPNFCCSICKDFFDPDKTIQLECDHLFCRDCIDSINSIAIYPCVNCPICAKRVKYEFIKDCNKFAYNMLSEVKIYCSNEDCKEINTVGNLKSHLKTCDYSKVDCPYCDNKNIFRKDLKKHIVSNLEDHLLYLIDDIEKIKKKL